MSQSLPKLTDNHEETILRQICNSFRPPDNVRRDRKRENSLILEDKASAVTHGLLPSPELVPLIGQHERRKDGTVAPLDCEEHLPSGSNPFLAGRQYNHVLLGYEQGAPALLALPNPYIPYDYLTGQALRYPPLLASFWKQSLFSVVAKISWLRKPEQLLERFGISVLPYGALTMPGRGRLRPARPGPRRRSGVAIGWRDAPPAGLSAPELAQWYVTKHLFDRARNVPLEDLPELAQTHASAWSPLITFLDEHGRIVQQVLKYFDPETQRKLLVPVTLMEERGIRQVFEYCIPCLGLQPLYGLDELTERPDDLVILTSALELPRLNQPYSKAIWISFLCDPGHFEQVDWSPLKGRKFCLLITNHSGRSLEESYIEAEELVAFLTEETEIEMDFRFLQVHVEYPQPKARYGSLAGLVQHLTMEPPRVRRDSVRIMDYGQFLGMVAKARERLETPFYIDGVEPAPEPDDNGGTPHGRLVQEPILVERAVTALHAPAKHGKSSFVQAMCGAILSGSDFLPEIRWQRPSGLGDAKGLVVYFSFEDVAVAGKESIGDRMRPYLAEDEEIRGEQLSRFLHVDMLPLKRDCRREEDRLWMLEQVQAHRNKFPPESPLVVVFDPYFAMVGYDQKGSHWGEVSEFLKIVAALPAAVCLVHHSEKHREDSPAASHHVGRDARCLVSLRREGRKGGTLTDPVTLEVQPTSWIPLNTQYDGVQIHRDPKTLRWKVCEEVPEKAKGLGFGDYFLARLVRECRSSGMMDKDIFPLLGIPRSTYTDMKRRVKKVLGKGWEKAPNLFDDKTDATQQDQE